MSTTIAAAPKAGSAAPADVKAGGKPQKEKKAKKSKKKLLILVVLLVALAAGGWYFFLRGGESATPAPPEKGAVLALESININLADGHYLKLGMTLQLTTAVKHEPEGSMALDIAIDQLSGEQMSKLVSTEGRRKAKERLVAEIEKAYHHDVMGVNLTEYVMQ